MKRITCCECGKSYNYEQDEFCPKCGAYNPPGGHGGVSDHARVTGAEELTRPARTGWGLKGLASVLVIVLVALLIFGIATYRNQKEPEVVTHALNSSFQVAGKQITLKNPRWVTVSEDLLAEFGWDELPDDFRLLVLDVRVTTADPELNGIAPNSVNLGYSEDGGGSEMHFWPDEHARWQEETGLDPISLSACADSNATLNGQLLYVVEGSHTEDEATLTISEFGHAAGASRIVIAKHVVPLDLSEVPTAAVSAEA